MPRYFLKPIVERDLFLRNIARTFWAVFKVEDQGKLYFCPFSNYRIARQDMLSARLRDDYGFWYDWGKWSSKDALVRNGIQSSAIYSFKKS